jgi:hypothetical protein
MEEAENQTLPVLALIESHRRTAQCSFATMDRSILVKPGEMCKAND